MGEQLKKKKEVYEMCMNLGKEEKEMTEKFEEEKQLKEEEFEIRRNVIFCLKGDELFSRELKIILISRSSRKRKELPRSRKTRTLPNKNSMTSALPSINQRTRS